MERVIRARAYVVVWALFMAVTLVACAPSKASLDMSMSQGIIWPGAPEKARIKYLWSLRRVSGGEAGVVVRAIAGEDDYYVEEPRYSSFLVNPQGVYVDGLERLYITDTGAARVSVIDLKTMESFNIIGDREFMLFTPIGVVADLEGNIYVSDAGLRRVVVFNKGGRFVRFFKGTFERPTGLAIDAEGGRVYVADTWAHRIYVYSLEGERLLSIGSDGSGDEKLNYPTYITMGGDGNLYVADTLNFKVKAFSPGGGLVLSFGLLGDDYGAFDKIKGIAVDSEGHIYVTDSAQDMVKIFDRQGRLLLFYGGKGGFYGKFAHPAGIYIDGADRIFVADMLNRRLQVFQFLGGG